MIAQFKTAASMIGVIVTESLKYTVALSIGLMILTIVLSLMSAIAGNTESLINSVEGVFMFYIVTFFFVLTYFISRKVTGYLNPDNYYMAKRSIP